MVAGTDRKPAVFACVSLSSAVARGKHLYLERPSNDLAQFLNGCHFSRSHRLRKGVACCGCLRRTRNHGSSGYICRKLIQKPVAGAAAYNVNHFDAAARQFLERLQHFLVPYGQAVENDAADRTYVLRNLLARCTAVIGNPLWMISGRVECIRL